MEKQTVTALIPPGLPPGKTAYLALFPAADLKSSLSEWFDTHWAGMLKDYRVLQGGQAKPLNENGFESISTSAAVAEIVAVALSCTPMLPKDACRKSRRVLPSSLP